MEIRFRVATTKDLPEIIRLLSDDFLGRQREDVSSPLNENYVNAFREIETDPNNELIIAELDGEIIGTLQLIITPSLSYQGGKRSMVESVRVDGKYRGGGIGRDMMLWAIDRARQKGCISMQLTSHNDRTDAHRFYDKLGFVRSHLGMKLQIKR